MGIVWNYGVYRIHQFVWDGIEIPSGKHWKWWFLVELQIENGDFP
jgi:hypothetical protein